MIPANYEYPKPNMYPGTCVICLQDFVYFEDYDVCSLECERERIIRDIAKQKAEKTKPKNGDTPLRHLV